MKNKSSFSFRNILIILTLLIAEAMSLCLADVFTGQVYKDSYYAELGEKIKFLKDKSDKKRIIVIGGSAVAFGIDSQMIESEMDGYEAVNFGLYAGLGTKVMIDLAEPFVRQGDIVIIIPEVQKQTLSKYFNARDILKALESCRKEILCIKAEDWDDMICAYPYYVIGKIKLHDKELGLSGIYSKSSFNDHGDIKINLIKENVMTDGYDPSVKIEYSRNVVDSGFVDYLNDFASDMDKRKARVFFCLSPADKKAVVSCMKEIEDFKAYLTDVLDFPVLMDAKDTVMGEGYFYDTDFHLNYKGRTLYTYEIIKGLKALLEDSSVTKPLDFYIARNIDRAYSVHEEYRKEVVKNNDLQYDMPLDEAEKIFILEKKNQSFAIKGLTEYGKKIVEMEVPSSIDGKKVSRMMEGAFNDDVAVQKVTLYPGIGVIEDNCFENCVFLKEIVLLDDDPASCHVGNNLLSGTGCFIKVPEKSSSRYKLSYWWSQYGERIHE